MCINKLIDTFVELRSHFYLPYIFHFLSFRVTHNQCCQIRNVKVSYQNLKIIVFWEKWSYKNQTHKIYIFYNNFIFQKFYSQFKQAV